MEISRPLCCGSKSPYVDISAKTTYTIHNTLHNPQESTQSEAAEHRGAADLADLGYRAGGGSMRRRRRRVG